MNWQAIAKEVGASDKEKLAIWMIENSFATGHGDTMDDLLKELSWQVKELRYKNYYTKKLLEHEAPH